MLETGITFFGQCSAAQDDRCCVAPAPSLKKKIDKAIEKMRKDAPDGMKGLVALRAAPNVSFNDGLIIPGTELPLGTPPMAARNFLAQRAPLSGDVRVVVVLAEFADQSFGTGAADRFQSPNARDMALHAAQAANPSVNFGPYDNDGDGFVDAFVVVRAGPGAEVTGSGDDIWSHKWVMRNQYNADGTKLYAYLTIPEDARLGVCAHELGHLLFGFPDLYDTDNTSEGVGNWCLMGGESWNGGGDTPAHPSAW